MLEDLINHFNKEFQYISEDRNKDKQELFLQFLKLLNNKNPNLNIEGIKSILNEFTRYLNSNVFVPLTLNEGEFIYTGKNEATNIRTPYVKMDTSGIYYEKAYRTAIVSIYSSFTGEQIYDNTIIPYNNRIYLVSGKFLTNVYFDKAYVRQRTIDCHMFIPYATIPVKIEAVAYNNQYITYINTLDNKFSVLKNYYDLKFKRDEDKFLENFNCNFNIQINGINTT